LVLNRVALLELRIVPALTLLATLPPIAVVTILVATVVVAVVAMVTILTGLAVVATVAVVAALLAVAVLASLPRASLIARLGSVAPGRFLLRGINRQRQAIRSASLCATDLLSRTTLVTLCRTQCWAIALQAAQGDNLQGAFWVKVGPHESANDSPSVWRENRPVGMPREGHVRQKVTLLKTFQVERAGPCLKMSTSNRWSCEHVLPYDVWNDSPRASPSRSPASVQGAMS
jgi:hypothetical protein